MNRVGFFIVVAALLTTGCGLASNEVKDRFKKVDESLGKSNHYVNGQVGQLMEAIKAKKSDHPLEAAKADSIYSAYLDENRYIDSLKEVLKAKDRTLESPDASEEVLITIPSGDTVMQKMSLLYALSRHAVADSNTVRLRTIFIDEEHPDNKERIRHYFHLVPTVAGITILTKFENDCLNMTRMALEGLAGEG